VVRYASIRSTCTKDLISEGVVSCCQTPLPADLGAVSGRNAIRTVVRTISADALLLFGLRFSAVRSMLGIVDLLLGLMLRGFREILLSCLCDQDFARVVYKCTFGRMNDAKFVCNIGGGYDKIARRGRRCRVLLQLQLGWPLRHFTGVNHWL
jgi:hypothetical protein